MKKNAPTLAGSSGRVLGRASFKNSGLGRVLGGSAAGPDIRHSPLKIYLINLIIGTLINVMNVYSVSRLNIISDCSKKITT